MEDKKTANVIIALTLSVLTVIGGHFVNRRLDRVILFFALILLAVIIPSVAYYSGLIFIFENDFEDMLRNYKLAYESIIWSGLAIWIISVLITIKDTRTIINKNIPELSFLTKSSGVILSILLGAITWSVVYFAFLYYQVSGQYELTSSEDSAELFDVGRSSSFMNKFFYQYINYGGYRYGTAKLADLPDGEGYLSGKITYNGEPVVNIVLDMVLNGKYEIKEVETDSDGRFQIRLPEGTWYVNRIDSKSWRDKPEGEYVLLSEHERKLKNNHYSRSQKVGDKGLEVQVSNDSNIDVINLSVKEAVNISWPERDNPDAPVDIKSDTITWLPYTGAEKYRIKITSITREGTSTSYHSVLQIVTENQGNYPLANLEIVESGNANDVSEYGVEISAFNGEGDFLSESDSFTPKSSFKLKGGLKILDNHSVDILSSFSSTSVEDTQKLFKNRKKLNAIEVLISEGKFVTANEMLDELDGPLDAGKKKALEGYLLAEQGKCNEAIEAFEQAKKEGGSNCVPSLYKEGCNL